MDLQCSLFNPPSKLAVCVLLALIYFFLATPIYTGYTGPIFMIFAIFQSVSECQCAK